MKKYFLLLAIAASLSGCTAIYPVSLVDPPTRNQSLVETTLELPAGLEIVSVDYDAELYTVASDGDTSFEGEHGRPFVKVHAIDRDSKEHYLLIYESLGHRSRPVQVIRFQEKY